MGISQGGWIAPLAASRVRGVAWLVLDVGPAVTVEQQELDNVAYTMKANEQSETDIAEAVAYTRAVFDAAYRGASVDALIAQAAAARAKPWAEYVQVVEEPSDLDGWRLSRYDPAEVLRQTRVPVLALYGERDPLVPPADNVPLMERYLKEAGNRDVTIRVIARADHNMEMNRQLEGGAWEWPAKFWVWNRRSPVFFETVESWVRDRTGRR